MYFSDDSLWPVCLCVHEGVQSLEQHEQMIEVWNEWFKREGSFIAIRVHKDEASLAQADGVARMTKKWLRDGAAELIRKRISAILNVAPNPAYERMKHLSVEKVFGVPGGVFPGLDEAMIWLDKSGSVELGAAFNHSSVIQIVNRSIENV